MNRRSIALLVLLLSAASLPAWGAPPTVAVLYFDNQGNPELEPLKVGFAQILITDLQANSTATIVERARLQAILDELELGHSGKVDPKTAAKVGKLLGAQWLVLGSYFYLMETLRVDARLVEVETGRIESSSGASGSTSAFSELAATLARDLAKGLAKSPTPGGPKNRTLPDASKGAEMERSGTKEGTDTELARPDARPLEAALAFSEGLMALDRKDTERARESFEKSVAADPSLAAAREELEKISL